MQALCCLPFPRKRVRIADENAITTLDKVTPPSYDFVSNEDADYQQYLWHLVLEEKTWSFAEARKLVNGTDTVTDMTTPETYLQGLTAAYNESGFGQHMPRIREIFANVESFTHAITIMVQSDMICSLLWGSLMLVFQVSPRPCPCHTDYFYIGMTELTESSLFCAPQVSGTPQGRCSPTWLSNCHASTHMPIFYTPHDSTSH